MDDPVKKENMAAEMLRAADVMEEAGAPELVVRGNRAIGNYIAELEAKNAELREAVRKLDEFTIHHTECAVPLALGAPCSCGLGAVYDSPAVRAVMKEQSDG